MLSKLDENFRFFQTALNLRSARQQVLATNIANADTPNYKAKDFDFALAMENALSGKGAVLDRTQAGHMAGFSGPGGVKDAYSIPYQTSLDGNTVEMDVERNKYMDNAVHYEAGLTFLSGQIKTMLAAIQG